MTTEAINTDQAAGKILGLLSGQSLEQQSNKDAGQAAQAENPAQKKKKSFNAVKTEANTQPVQEAQGAEPAQADGESQADPFAEAETEATDDQSETDTDQEAAEGEAGEQEGGEGDEEQTFKLKISGEEVTVTLKELVDGYHRQSDYSRNMQAIAKERRELEAVKEQTKDLPEVHERYKQGAERFTKNAQLVLAALENGFMPKPPPVELAESNPGAYLKQKEAYQAALQFREAIGGELKRLEHETMQEHQKSIAEGRTKLMTALPELKDQANRHKLVEYAKKHGFRPDQIANEPSPILFQWAWKAMKFDEIMEHKNKIASDKPKPKVMAQSKAPVEAKSVADRKRTEILSSHKKNGNIQTGTAAISAILGK